MRLKKLASVLITASTVLSLFAANAFAAGKGAVAINEANFPDEVFRSHLKGFDANNNDVLDVGEFDGNLTFGLPAPTDLTGIDKLYVTTLDWRGTTPLEKIDLSGNPEIETLNIVAAEPKIDVLDLSYNTNVKEMLLRITGDGVPLKFGTMPKLKNITLMDNALTKLDLNFASNLEYALLYINNVTEIDISGCPNLNHFEIQTGFKYTELDISNNPILSRTYKETPRTLGLNSIYEWKAEDGSETYGYLRISNKATITVNDDVADVTPLVTPTPTPDPVEAFVERLYTCALKRDFDPDGKATWTGLLRDGSWNGGDVAYGFFFAPEITDANITDDDYITRLYKTFLDRDADSEGLATWTQYLADGHTRYETFMGFVNSDEWSAICKGYDIASGNTSGNTGVSAFATRLYTTCLGRKPGDKEVQDWTNYLTTKTVTGSGAANGFFFSDEFKAMDCSDKLFVERLYATLMGRSADKEGLDMWVDFLASGKMTREEVFDGFAQSNEFANICANYGIDV